MYSSLRSSPCSDEGELDGQLSTNLQGSITAKEESKYC